MERFIHIANQNQEFSAYEIRFTTHEPELKWRTNHCVMVISRDAKQAVDSICERYANNLRIDSVQKRNNGMGLMIDREVLRCDD